MDEIEKIYGKSTGVAPDCHGVGWPSRKQPVGMPEGISGEELLKLIKNQTPEELEECGKRGAL
jgi:hypothetical protein